MIRRNVRWVAAIALIPAISLSVPALGQGTPGLRLQTHSFVFARYASASSSSLYAVNGLGPLGAFVGMSQNPTSQYRELAAGIFTQVSWSSQNVWVGVAYGDASESQYVLTYVAPSFSRGRLALSGTLKWYNPLGRSGIRQLHLNPASFEVRLTKHLLAGGVYILALEESVPPGHRVGSVVEWALPKASFRLEVLQRTSDRLVEVRCVVLASS